MKIKIKDRKVIVFGIARSGIGAANLLAELGANVTVTDIKSEGDLQDVLPRLDPSIRYALGGHPDELHESSDMVIISPGVPLNIPPLVKVKSKGIPVIGELELAYQIVTHGFCSTPTPPISPLHPHLVRGRRGDTPIGYNGKFLAVTGTNGKSTTTALLDFMMKKGGFRTILGGNIGSALTGEIHNYMKKSQILETRSEADALFQLNSDSRFPFDYVVTEVSSFQLESIQDFRPSGAAILNITPDHLDRYQSFGEYIGAKARIFENQNESDFLVLNRDDPVIMELKSEKLAVRSERSRLFYFSRKQEVEGLYSKNGMIYCHFPDSPFGPHPLPLIKTDEVKIRGVHNLENAMAASAIALLAGCSKEAITESLREFPGLEHRVEFVEEIDGVKYFNDSKGTNVSAVIKSLESFTEPIVLIAGGRDKAGDFSQLRQLVEERVKTLILIGEAAGKIKGVLGDFTDTVISKDLRDAVMTSRSRAVRGDVVVLSPACASFDMFENFEDRGRQFKKIVMEMNS